MMSEMEEANSAQQGRANAQAATWPSQPYKGLTCYGSQDRPLYAGRDADIFRCSSILMSTDTRTLILHGMTGCGKSSFLRAGLIPAVEEGSPATGFLRSGSDGELEIVFIRCTNAPVRQIAEKIFELAQRSHVVRTPVGISTIDLRAALGGCESVDKFRDRATEEGFLVETLGKMAVLLPITLIVILDQAEEVFTLNVDEKSTKHSDQFFSFLQDFNASALDVKMVISIRTEYFGRFVSSMNVERRVVRSDAKEYLLADFDEGMLLQAIQRPTLKKALPPYSAPYETYRFRFEDGLPEEIARDLVLAKQTSSLLPVMQIVCRSLYSALDKHQKDQVITRALYHKLGRVDGRIDQHISDSLIEAMKRGGVQPGAFAREEEMWRTALTKLVAVQPDGTVTTNVLPQSTLEAEARECGITSHVPESLDFLAGADVLLLRKTALVDNQSGRVVSSYSLGHDVLGLSLQRWQEAHEGVVQQRKQVQKVWLWSLTVLALGLSLAAIQYWYAKQSTARNAERIYQQAMVEGQAHFQLGLLLAVAASDLREDSRFLRFGKPNNSYLVNSLTLAPMYFCKLPYEKGSVPSIGARSGNHVLVNAAWPAPELLQHTYDINIETTIEAAQVPSALEKHSQIGSDSSFNCTSGSPHCSQVPMPHTEASDPPWLTAWAADGSKPITRSKNTVTQSSAGSLVPVSTFLKHVANLPAFAARWTLVEFGREEFYLVGPQNKYLLYDVIPIHRATSGGNTSYEALEPLSSVHVRAGNSNVLLVIPRDDNGFFEAKLLNLDNKKEITLFGADQKVTGTLLRFSRIPESPSSHRNVGAISFAPDDSAVGVSIRDDRADGTSSIRVMNFKVNWAAPAASSTTFSIDGDTDDIIMLATASGGADSAYWLATTNKLVSRRAEKPRLLFGDSSLKDIEFAGNGDHLFGITRKGTIMGWDTDIGAKKSRLESMSVEELRRIACSLTDRSLTDDEIAKFIGKDNRLPACGGGH